MLPEKKVKAFAVREIEQARRICLHTKDLLIARLVERHSSVLLRVESTKTTTQACNTQYSNLESTSTHRVGTLQSTTRIGCGRNSAAANCYHRALCIWRATKPVPK